MERFDVGGVPMLWEEGPDPGMVSVQFRVGAADERPARRGVTHLVEHLAMYGLGRTDHDENAFVEPLFTGFWKRGGADELAAFATGITRSLGDLPFPRMETELRVLRTETADDPSTLMGRLLTHRFGMAGFGGLNLQELGLRWLGPEDVEAWRRERFTTGQAALWLHGPRPREDLALALPPGERHPLPRTEPLPGVRFPAWIADGTGGVGVAMLAGRGWATAAALELARRRLHERLRVEEGLVYDVHADFESLGAEQAHVVLAAGCLDEHAERVAAVTLDVLEELASSGSSEEEVTTARDRAGRSDPGTAENVRARLDLETTELLLGAAPGAAERDEADLDRLDPAAVAEALRDALGTALVIVPEGCPRPREDLATLERRLPAVEGRRFKARGLRQGDELVVGEAGLTLTDDDGVVTIPAGEVAFVSQGSGGALTVHGVDGSWVEIDPAALQEGDAFRSALGTLSPDPYVPSADERAGLVRRLAAEQLERHWTVRDELDLPPELLADDEQPRLIAEADRGARTGLLVLTDRRVLFVYEGLRKEEFLQFPLAEIRGAEGGGGFIGSGKLRLELEGDALRFTGVVPKGRAAEFVAALRERDG